MAGTLLKTHSTDPIKAGAPLPSSSRPAHCEDHSRGLLLIGLFKLGKCVVAVISGMAAYHWANVDLGALAVKVIGYVRIINPVGSFAQQLISRADDMDAHDLRRLGVLSFVLASLYLIEGTGLMLRKVWAEYFTVVVTSAAMPYEIYQMAERFSMMKLTVLVLNAAVVAYLAVLLLRNRRGVAQCA